MPYVIQAPMYVAHATYIAAKPHQSENVVALSTPRPPLRPRMEKETRKIRGDNNSETSRLPDVVELTIVPGVSPSVALPSNILEATSLPAAAIPPPSPSLMNAEILLLFLNSGDAPFIPLMAVFFLGRKVNEDQYEGIGKGGNPPFGMRTAADEDGILRKASTLRMIKLNTI
jgi:hypothetical protein